MVEKRCLLNILKLCIVLFIFSETLIKLLISAPNLNEEQYKAVHTMLSVQVETYLEVHDHSTDKLKGALTKFITETFRLLFKDPAVGWSDLCFELPNDRKS